MDFFQHQESARKKTGLLVFYFIVAVVLIVLLVYGIVVVTLDVTGSRGAARVDQVPQLWDPGLFGVVSLLTLTLIGGGSAYRIASLASGGHNVAEMMGGRPLLPQTADPDERKILNVVEEMAIASGTPVPPVYLMEQERQRLRANAPSVKPGQPIREKWWAERGSGLYINDEEALEDVIHYVLEAQDLPRHS